MTKNPKLNLLFDINKWLFMPMFEVSSESGLMICLEITPFLRQINLIGFFMTLVKVHVF